MGKELIDLQRPLRDRVAIACAAILSVLALAGTAAAVEIAFGFEGPRAVTGLPGEVKSFPVHVTISTADNEFPDDGVQGWSLVAMAIGGRITGIEIDGLTVSTICDQIDPQNPEGPRIRRDPYFQDLGAEAVFTNVAALFPDQPGLESCAVSAVLLRATERMVLQPSGTQRVARLTVQVEIPAGGECAPVKLDFESGPQLVCPHPPAAEPAVTRVTFRGESVRPGLDSVEVRVCPVQFRRGDSNADTRVDISDIIHILQFLFLGGPAPSCRAAADVNRDGVIDITDPIFLVNDLYAPVSAIPIPAPGPFNCGVDPVAGGLLCEESPACP